MSLSETKYLIQKYGIRPNKFYGQNFMVDPSIFPRLANYALLHTTDVVLEVGSGFGFLTRFLANNCQEVLAVEKDQRITLVLRGQLSGLDNVKIIEGDVLKTQIPEFDKVVSIPPYQISSHLLLWLFNRNFSCAVLIFQKEFAKRLVASVGTEDYGWLTVFAHYNAQVELLDDVPKEMFYPQPKIDSVIVRLAKRKHTSRGTMDHVFFKGMLRFLFTNRNKKVGNALASFVKSAFRISAEETQKLFCALPFLDKRVRSLIPEDFEVIANALVN